MFVTAVRDWWLKRKQNQTPRAESDSVVEDSEEDSSDASLTKAEKKQAAIKQKSIQQAGVLFDTFETLDGDSTGMSNSYVDFLQENMNEINYKPRGSKKKD